MYKISNNYYIIIFKVVMPRVTYLDLILNYLTEEPQSLDLKFFTGDKTTYAIAAVKKGIDKGVIIKIDQPNIETKYKGHLYYLNKSSRKQSKPASKPNHARKIYKKCHDKLMGVNYPNLKGRARLFREQAARASCANLMGQYKKSNLKEEFMKNIDEKINIIVQEEKRYDEVEDIKNRFFDDAYAKVTDKFIWVMIRPRVAELSDAITEAGHEYCVNGNIKSFEAAKQLRIDLMTDVMHMMMEQMKEFEPVKEPIPEPVKEPIPEPVKEPIPEPVKEPIPEPVKEPEIPEDVQKEILACTLDKTYKSWKEYGCEKFRDFDFKNLTELKKKFQENRENLRQPVIKACRDKYCDDPSAEWKKCYRKKAIKLHPDKPTGDEYEFRRLNECNQDVEDI